MAKNCSVCGNRINIMTSRLKFQDGTICSNCYKKAGLKGKIYEYAWASQTPTAYISELIDSGKTIDVKAIVDNEKQEEKETKLELKKEKQQAIRDELLLSEKFDGKNKNRLLRAFALSNPTKIAHEKFWFDDSVEVLGFNLSFGVPSEILKYSQVVDYEIHQNGSSVSRGSVNFLRGAGMGLATGGLGLIVGLATGGKQKTKEMSEKIEIFIKTNDPENPTYTLVTSAKRLKIDSKQYAQDFKDTQDIAATLDRIIKRNEERGLIDQNEQQVANVESSVDPLEEIAKLKKLRDMDAITQDEFEAKKKQLLDL